jgi:hypothetical protein
MEKTNAKTNENNIYWINYKACKGKDRFTAKNIHSFIINNSKFKDIKLKTIATYMSAFSKMGVLNILGKISKSGIGAKEYIYSLALNDLSQKELSHKHYKYMKSLPYKRKSHKKNKKIRQTRVVEYGIPEKIELCNVIKTNERKVIITIGNVKIITEGNIEIKTE